MKKFILTFIIITMLSVFGIVVFANTGEDDPLISKSFFDDSIAQLKSEIFEKIDKSESNQSSSNSSDGKTLKFEPLNFKEGTQIYMGEGCEFILRSGLALVIDPTENGLSNLTSGSNLLKNDEIPMNNLIVCPRSDGRGIVCEEEIWIMIKGEYAAE